MNQMFRDVYPNVPVPKSVWSWIDAAQHRLAVAGVLVGFSIVDPLVGGAATLAGLVVLHGDTDYELAARHLPDVETRRVVSVGE
jgi:predicted nucleic acid-binding protein